MISSERNPYVYLLQCFFENNNKIKNCQKKENNNNNNTQTDFENFKGPCYSLSQLVLDFVWV